MNWQSLISGSDVRGVAMGEHPVLTEHIAKCLGMAFARFTAQKTGKPVRILLTVLEWVMYAGALVITLLTLPYGWEYGALAFIFGGVLLSFSGLTYSGEIFDNNVCYFLGKITLPVYLSQLSAIYAVNYYMKDYDDVMKAWAIAALTVISSAITMIAGNALAKVCSDISFGKKDKTAAA